MLRSHTLGELRKDHSGSAVTLCGWVHRRRDHGGLIFIDLRDRYGFTQVVFDPEDCAKEIFTIAETVRPEWVLKVEGVVRPRIESAVRDDHPTGAIEVLISSVTVLNESKTPPFEIDVEKTVGEETRLEYRYLDLRRPRMQRNILMRHKLLQAVRKYFYDRDFVEVETPILIKGTPEGAREYLVPSRVHHGEFYVLPQSPQQLKQLTMIAGLDRYMQIARCFRDEDQRGDRQPEFTQVDVEMSFVQAEDVMEITEDALITITKALRSDVQIKEAPFPHLTYDQAMHTYGSDKPDLRYDLPFTDVTELCRGCGFSIFAGAVEHGSLVKALCVRGGALYSRKDIDELTEIAKVYGAKGLAWIKVTDSGFDGVPVPKLGDELTRKIAEKTHAAKGDIILFAADAFRTACESLGAVRIEIARRQNLIDPKLWSFVWITDFPMFEKDKETGELAAMHHPFTRPNKDSLDLLKTNPLEAKAEAYDVALNGYEIAGGSVRIHEQNLQKLIFDILGVTDKEAERRFGHMLRAFEFGAPPHGGIAWGFDRLTMIFCDEPNIREVIAYPKDQKAKDLMLGAPTPIPEKQLKELGVQVTKE
ncbi:MAG TPA: aspartate--tRNA ligase [Candidatus Peribacterales bacterium]|nr:aspartate--tRNA ligase [Candidatus Peribacterales bacterium]